jgi:peptidoglycan-N-acetylglucosamine deacetylase
MRFIRAIFFAAVVGIPGEFVTLVHAQNCPGNPDALGTSRVIVVGPAEYTRLGTMRRSITKR